MFADGPPAQSPAQEAQHIQEDVLVQSERNTISVTLRPTSVKMLNCSYHSKPMVKKQQ